MMVIKNSLIDKDQHMRSLCKQFVKDLDKLTYRFKRVVNEIQNEGIMLAEEKRYLEKITRNS